MATILLIVVGLTAMMAVGTVFALVVLRVIEENRDVEDTRRLHAIQSYMWSRQDNIDVGRPADQAPVSRPQL